MAKLTMPAERSGPPWRNLAARRGTRPEDQTTDKRTIQRIRELDLERTALFETAKDEALRKAHQAIEDLNALGLNCFRTLRRAVDIA
jgi:hypothetical protein